MKRLDRKWMYERLDNKKRIKLEFRRGVKEFIDHAKRLEEFGGNQKIRCPCKNCRNLKYLHEAEVREHLITKGFCVNYYNWVSHGEKFPVNEEKSSAKKIHSVCDLSFESHANDEQFDASKAKKVYDRCASKKANYVLEGSQINENEPSYDVVSGSKKEKVDEVDSATDLFLKPTKSSSSTSTGTSYVPEIVRVLQSQVQELQQKLMMAEEENEKLIEVYMQTQELRLEEREEWLKEMRLMRANMESIFAKFNNSRIP